MSFTSIYFRIQTQGIKEVISAIDAAPKRGEKKVDARLGKLARAAAKAIQAKAPVGKRNPSGRLRKSIKAKHYSHMLWVIEEGMMYGWLQRMGVKGGYKILPWDKKALWWPGIGHPISMVKSHPGFKANDYVLHAKGDVDALKSQASIDITNIFKLEISSAR